MEFTSLKPHQVKIHYYSYGNRDYVNITRGYIKNVGSRQIIITNTNGCLEIISIDLIVLMTEIK